MTDATKPLPTDKAPSKLGRNQLIGIGLTAVPIVLGFALVCMGKLDSKDWITFSQTTATAGTGITLGGSALVKAIEAFRK